MSPTMMTGSLATARRRDLMSEAASARSVRAVRARRRRSPALHNRRRPWTRCVPQLAHN